MNNNHNTPNPAADPPIYEISDHTQNAPRLQASVIIVAYNPNKSELSETLTALSNQTCGDFETILVDNSPRHLLNDLAEKHHVKYIKMSQNAGPSGGRNAGTENASSNILIFLDDDALPADDFVAQHLTAHNTLDIVACRGKILPRTKKIYNLLNNKDNLGDEITPWLLDKEGNCSIQKDILLKAGGFSTNIPLGGGHEGNELSSRICKIIDNPEKIIYYPGALIYHDFYGTHRKYFKKVLRHKKSTENLYRNFPDLKQFEQSYYNSLKPMKFKHLSLINRARLDTIRRLTRLLQRL